MVLLFAWAAHNVGVGCNAAGFPQAVSPVTAASSERKPSTARFPGYRFVSGRSIAYHLEYSSVSNADLGVLFQDLGAARPQQTQSSGLAYALAASLRGQVIATTVTTSPDRVQVFHAFGDLTVHLTVNGQEQIEQADEVTRELSRGLLVDLTPQGKVIGVYIAPDVSKLSADFTRTLLALLQVVFPIEPPRNKDSWTVPEEDRCGAYTALYQIVSGRVAGHSDWIQLRKSKRSYFTDVSATGEQIPGRSEAIQKILPNMSFEAKFDPHAGELMSLGGTETQDTIIQNKTVAHSKTILRLTRVSDETVPAAEIDTVRRLNTSLVENSSCSPLFVPRSSADIEANIQRSELGSATVTELRDRLTSLEAGSLDQEEQQAAETSLYLKFKALIYLHPEVCEQLEKLFATADLSSPSFQILTGALSAVGHPQAQQALIHSIEARRPDPAALLSLISSLGSLPHPTTETEMTVKEMAVGSSDPNVSGTALLVLGSLAKNLSGNDPKHSDTIVDFLMQRVEVSHSETERQHLLQALGNAASARAMPLVTRFASAPSPVLRAAAADALRWISLPEVDGLLLNALVADQDSHVRLEAAFALSFRQSCFKSYKTQKAALTREGDEKVRAAVLGNLAKMHQRFPEVRRVLQGSAAKDPSKYVRIAANGLLQQLSAAGGNGHATE